MLVLRLLCCILLPVLAAVPAQGLNSQLIGGTREHDLFSSTDGLKRLFDKEREMYARLKAFREHTERQLKALDDLMEKQYKVWNLLY